MSNYQRFDIVRNGYDTFQVNSEIDRLTAQINALNEKILTYQRQIETVSSQFNQIRTRYQQIANELSMREKAVDDVGRLALREANSVIETAHNNADDIINEAMVNAQNVLKEVEQYKQETMEIKRDLRLKLEEYLRILDKYELPDAPKITERMLDFDINL